MGLLSCRRSQVAPGSEEIYPEACGTNVAADAPSAASVDPPPDLLANPPASTGPSDNYTGSLNHKGEREGEGTLHLRTGDTYTGSFFAGRFEGSGRLVTINVGEYSGQFVGGRLHGAGVYTDLNGERYAGQFADGQMQGDGCYRWPDGSLYTGQFHEGEMHGQGAHSSADGNVTVGMHRSSTKAGPATVHFCDGTAKIGTYTSGVFSAPGVTWSADRTAAWRMRGNQNLGSLTADEARSIADRLGLAVPSSTEEIVARVARQNEAIEAEVAAAAPPPPPTLTPAHAPAHAPAPFEPTAADLLRYQD
mmetsp:Transcript_50591/g.113686  ORF Transcript_50591/g.113686 Transcript_50591/m.113686 type:complete len:306 (-) Transcript_50591:233-1150(-)